MTFRLILAALLALATLPARAAESYDNCTGFIDTLPASINTQGVWCLRANLATAMTSGAAITVAGNNITIDCNEFKIGGLAAGPGSGATGIIASSRQNVTVRNCGLRGFYEGIVVSGGAGHLIEDNRIDNCLSTGIRVQGDDSVVQRNRVFDMDGGSFRDRTWSISTTGDVVDNIISGATGSASGFAGVGIVAEGPGSVVKGNRIRGLLANGAQSAFGILVGSGAIRVEGNHLSSPAPANNVGIRGFASSVCVGNSVVGFNTPMSDCALSADNHTL